MTVWIGLTGDKLDKARVVPAFLVLQEDLNGAIIDRGRRPLDLLEGAGVNDVAPGWLEDRGLR